MKRLRMVLLLAMVVLCILGNAVVKTEAKSITTKAWASAYLKIAKIYNEEDKEYKAKSTLFYTPYTYDLIYFDKDSIPEFVVGRSGYWVSMYTYNKKTQKAFLLMDRWGYGAMGNYGYEYLPKKNVIYNQNNDYAGSIVNHNITVLKKGKLVCKYSKRLTEEHFIDKNKNGRPDENEYTTEARYYYGNKKISEKKFKSYIPKGVYKRLAGESSFAKIKKKLETKGAQ